MSRPLSDHGTAQQAIDWAIDHNPDGGLEAEAFLRCWREGRLDEWPEFYAWLALEEARSPVISRQSSEEQYPQSETQSSAGNDARDTINTTSQIQHVPRREGEELKPCPFCGSQDVSVRPVGSGRMMHSVLCACDAEGPWAHTPEQAANNWNRRPTQPPETLKTGDGDE